LILPHILGVTTSVVILTFYFVLSSCFASFLIASLGWHIPYQQFVRGIMLSLGATEVIVLFSKSVIFGLFVSATCCYGLSVGYSVTEFPKVATKAVMTSLFAVFSGWPDHLPGVNFLFLNQLVRIPSCKPLQGWSEACLSYC